jgi:hypothetical protein
VSFKEFLSNSKLVIVKIRKKYKKVLKLLVICNIALQYLKSSKVFPNYQNVSKRPFIFLYSYNIPILLIKKIIVKKKKPKQFLKIQKKKKLMGNNNK